MNRRKVGAISVLVVLALGVSWLLPGVAGAGKERSLVERVGVLEDQVALLTARVEELEAGAGSCACTCDVLHLTPLPDFPSDPSEGDLCVVGAGEDRHVYSYLDGDWVMLEMLPPPIPPGPGPPTEPLP